jgi:hypothetical protein
VVTNEGVFYTRSISASPIRWTALGRGTTPNSICGLYVSIPKLSAPVFYAQSQNCDGRGPSNIYRLDGISATSNWKQVQMPDSNGGFGVFAVDAHNPLRMFASFVRSSGTAVSMVTSADGGAHWVNDPFLDQLMTQHSTLKYRTVIGPTDFTSFNGYPQPSLIAYDPGNDKIIVAAGIDSGLFISLDGGLHWETVQPQGHPLFRVRAATFVRISPSEEAIFVGSQGNGIWRINLSK